MNMIIGGKTDITDQEVVIIIEIFGIVDMVGMIIIITLETMGV